MKTILLLTDFSDCATNAIHYAVQLFQNESCKMYLMHVHKAGSFTADDLMLSSPNQNIYEAITTKPKENLEKLARTLKEQYNNPKHEFELLIDFDVFTDAINQVVEAKSVDMVVLGSNGVTGAIEVVFGSNTINVIRNVTCKTMVIPNNYEFKPISNFLLPLQFDDAIEKEQLELITSFVETHKLNLHVLRVCAKGETQEHVKHDLSQVEQFNCAYNIEEEIRFYDAVTNYLEDHDIDMTGLIVHDKSFIKRFFTESPAFELSRVIKLPLVIFHTDAA